MEWLKSAVTGRAIDVRAWRDALRIEKGRCDGTQLLIWG